MRLPLAPTAALACCTYAFAQLPAQTPLRPRNPEPSASTAPALPITRVALYKNGVGFFEHAGRVTGDQSVTIDFTSAQLNDVLQSLTAVDLNGGRISGAGYNSTTPLEQQLKTLPIPLDADADAAAFYNAIRGSRIQVTGAGAPITGRLLAFEQRTTPTTDTKPAFERDLLTVISDSGEVRTLEVTPTTSVHLLDNALHTDVTHYLELIASSRSQGLRHLTLLDRGPAATGPRDLRVSYISEVPVWKSTYRILFTDTKQADATATLQGWSVVDNTTGSDWLNVHLDLIAGAPQSFIQPLSIPLYARRPEIAMPGNQQFAPQTFESGDAEAKAISGPAIVGTVTDPAGAAIPNARIVATNTTTSDLVSANSRADGSYTLAVAFPGQYRVETSSPGFQATNQTVTVSQQPVPLTILLNPGAANESVTVTAAAGQMMSTESAMSAAPSIRGRNTNELRKLQSTLGYGSSAGMGGSIRRIDGFTGGALPPAPIPNYAEAAQSSLTPQTSSSAFDDFFQYSLTDPITIRKNESALVPILQTKLPIERVTLWSRQQPVALRALWLTNASTLTLDRGSFSIVENGSFGGEGLLDPIHPGEKRLLSYAADQAVRVDNQTGPGQRRLRSVVIAKGILTQQFTDVVEREYNIRNAAPDPRTVVIEHTRTPGFTLQPTPTPWGSKGQPDETLPNAYRFRVPVPAGTTVKLSVAESRTSPTYLQIGNINQDQIRIIVQQLGGSNSTLLQQLQPVLDAQRTLADLNTRKATLDDKLETLDSEEQRQRSNIDALKNVDKVTQKRFVDELGHIEDQILTLQKDQTTLETQIEAAQKDLNNKVEAVQFTQALEP